MTDKRAAAMSARENGAAYTLWGTRENSTWTPAVEAAWCEAFRQQIEALTAPAKQPAEPAKP